MDDKSLKKVYYGYCEWHHEYSSCLRLLRLKQGDKGIGFLSDEIGKFYNFAFFACDRCDDILVREMKIAESCEMKLPITESAYTDNISDNLISKLASEIASLQNIFPELIDGIYIAPSGQCNNERFVNKLNIVVSFKFLSFTQYISNAIRYRDKCLYHYWKNENTSSQSYYPRQKFWSIKTTRILLALGALHAKSKNLAIWIWGDSRIVSIELFTNTPPKLIQIMPTKLLRIVRYHER